jgi:hypothetical protein
MKIRFKDGQEKACSSIVEQKIFRGGSPTGWVMTFQMSGVLGSDELDKIITKENISHITILKADGTEKATVEGYNTVNSVSVRYRTDVDVTEVQLTKPIVEL